MSVMKPDIESLRTLSAWLKRSAESYEKQIAGSIERGDTATAKQLEDKCFALNIWRLNIGLAIQALTKKPKRAKGDGRS